MFVGNSAGAYISLLLGALLDVDAVHAFAPITLLDETVLPQESKEFLRIMKTEVKDKNFFDLKKIFETKKLKGTFHLYYDFTCLDVKHVNNISANPAIVHHIYGTGGHEVIKELKKSGVLKEILMRAIQK